mmetsp:Transcript_19905/g.64804  ORF Transcript_19905/g.64804 Transcript_19905/m.64804 type:complete len:214 (+) Transcript_19905:1228-1869(+)
MKQHSLAHSGGCAQKTSADSDEAPAAVMGVFAVTAYRSYRPLSASGSVSANSRSVHTIARYGPTISSARKGRAATSLCSPLSAARGSSAAHVSARVPSALAVAPSAQSRSIASASAERRLASALSASTPNLALVASGAQWTATTIGWGGCGGCGPARAARARRASAAPGDRSCAPANAPEGAAHASAEAASPQVRRSAAAAGPAAAAPKLRSA